MENKKDVTVPSKNITNEELIKIGVLFILFFTFYIIASVMPVSINEVKIINSRELDNARRVVNIFVAFGGIGVVAGIITTLVGLAGKYIQVKKILKIITGYAWFEKIVYIKVNNKISDEEER